MELEKAKKRIAKYVNKGFDGYPVITFAYIGIDAHCATELEVSFCQQLGDETQVQTFRSASDARFDDTIQTVLLKIIERAMPKTVTEIPGITLKAAL